MADDETPRSAVPDKARKSVTMFMLALGVTVVLYLFSIPLAYGMFVTAPVAIFYGIRILVLTRGEKELGVFRLSITFGLAMAGFAMFVGAGLLLFHDIVTDLSTCMSRAVTHSAVEACNADYEDGLNAKVEEIYERFGLTSPTSSSPSPSSSPTD
ncbi:hypothetical protein ON058_03720 [Demequina sp. B12]|uniref:hypothetical protein n=1 Tax=Demequina sp. B12 TaxID=2992757 RepID=UPI00237B92CD|nr:hypothetical protein [Demequina sp. B12]MDE0572518.1 hypothetical protein [Demequina sp. B12]